MIFLPHPQQLSWTNTVFSLPEHGLIALNSADVQAIWFTAVMLQDALLENCLVDYELVGGTAVPADQVAICLSIIPDSVRHPQGYELTIVDGRVDVVANSPAGLFYAVQTLIQLLEQTGDGRQLPTLRCRDWPDFPNRGVMLDISRDKVPTLQTLFELIDLLSSWKVNQLQLYTEHTFAYRRHTAVWQDASPLTAEEIITLDAYCHDRFIELLPNQNTFGHMHRWLTLPDYVHLAEKADGAQTPWGYYNPEPFSLSPVVPESLDLVRDLLDELLPNFRSRQVNIGADETYDLGQGRSQALVTEKGKGTVYLEHLLKIYREVKARGYTMQFWGDIIMEHPNLAKQLPRDVIALEWGYEANHPFADHGRIFAESGVPFYVCPGTSSWNSIAGRSQNAIDNLANAAENGLKHGAVGFLNTDWGDNGHWQPLPVSFLGFAAGAAFSWAHASNRDLEITAVLNQFAFRDSAGVMGELVYALGNLYTQLDYPQFNGTVYFYGMVFDLEKMVNSAESAEEAAQRCAQLEAVATAVDGIVARLAEADIQRDDAAFIQREFAWAAAMVKHGCRRLVWAIGRQRGQEDVLLRQQLAAEAEPLIEAYKQVWHGRNRPGGFRESVARLHKMAAAYQPA